MKKELYNRRIPTFFAIFALLGIIGITLTLLQNGIFYIGRASNDNTPQNTTISNINDTSFTFSFTTNTSTSSVIILQNSISGNITILDDRDKKTGLPKDYLTHYFTVPLLKPNTSYSFKVLVGGKEYENPNFKVTTGPEIKERPPIQKAFSGNIIYNDGSIGSDSLVIVKTSNSQVLTAITNDKGEYFIPTSSFKNTGLNQFILLLENTPVSITVFGKSLKSSVETDFINAQKLPAIILGEQYVFLNDKTSVPPQLSRLNELFPAPIITGLTILKPNDGDSLTDLRPTFNGLAFPNKKVSIQIGKDIKQELLSSTNGTWAYRPDSEFLPGHYIISVSSTDNSGRFIKTSSKFAILPQGSQILSAQLLPTTSPTIRPSITPIITNSPSITPSITITSSPIPTIQNPTITISPSVTITPTFTPVSMTPTISPTVYYPPISLSPIDKPGSINNTVALTSVSFILIFVGVTLLLIL